MNWGWRRLDRIEAKLDFIVGLVQVLILKEKKDMATLGESIDVLKKDVTQQITVVAGVVTLVKGLADKLAAALAAAQLAGATPEQLTDLQSLHTEMVGNNDALAKAVAENTVAIPSS